MTKKKTCRKRFWREVRKKVKQVTNLEAELPEMYLETISQKTKSLLSKIKAKSEAAKTKLFFWAKKLAETIRKYWQCLILSGKILIFVMKKIRGEGYLNCEKD